MEPFGCPYSAPQEARPYSPKIQLQGLILRLPLSIALGGGCPLIGVASERSRSGEERAAVGGLLMARQPILDRDRQVFAYQLLLHPLPPAPTHETAAANAEPASDALERCGLDALTLGKPAFLRMTPRQLGPAVEQAFPPGRVVVEVPNHGDGEEVADACEVFKRRGYAVAVDDFTLEDESTRVLTLADYLKVDFLPSSADHTRACVAAGQRAQVSLIAKSIDATEVFDEALREGFTYFQGRIFEQRRFQRGQTVRSSQLAALQLLQALADPNLSLPQIEDLVKRDAALSYRVLRLVNSAAAAQSREVTSMQHALLLVGRDTVRRWASVAIVSGLGCSAPDEVLTMAVVRARFCELLGAATGNDDAAGEGFLIGLCSMLDVILGRSMADILDDLPLTQEVRGALFGRDNRPRRLLDCAVAYERGAWATCLSVASVAGIPRTSMAPAYLDALHFAYELKRTN